MESKENILKSYISLFNEGYYTDNIKPEPFIKLFLEDQTEVNYNRAIKFFEDFLKKVNTDVTFTIRIVATVTNGIVWYHSYKDSTYQRYITNTISENFNTRKAYMQVLLLNNKEAYEIYISNITRKKEYRVCYKVSDDYVEPMGVIGFSITLE